MIDQITRVTIRLLYGLFDHLGESLVAAYALRRNHVVMKALRSHRLVSVKWSVRHRRDADNEIIHDRVDLDDQQLDPP